MILILGGLYLAYEGAEKVFEFIFPHSHKTETPKLQDYSEEEILKIEKEKIKSAVVTDFILSVEIIIIALGTVVNEPLLNQVLVVTLIALVATVGVYGIVALIIRMDEFGAKLIDWNEKENSISDKVGQFLVSALPKVIKSLSVIGTLALLLVSGGIFVHNIHYLHDLLAGLPGIIGEFLTGLVVGFLVLLVVKIFSKIWKKFSS